MYAKTDFVVGKGNATRREQVCGALVVWRGGGTVRQWNGGDEPLMCEANEGLDTPRMLISSTCFALA
jgi:hypothetical protein